MIGEVCAYLLNVVYSGAQVQIWPIDGDLYTGGRWVVAPKLDGLTPLYIGEILSDALLFCHLNNLNCEVNQIPTTTLDNCKRWHRWYDSSAVWRPGQEATE